MTGMLVTIIILIVLLALLKFRNSELTRELETAQTNLANAEERERLLSASIDITNNVVKDLNDKIASIESQNNTIKKSISDLEKSNAKVKNYLDSAVPAELARLYNERKNQIRSSGSTK